MSVQDTRREALDAGQARGPVFILAMMLLAETTPSGAADLNTNLEPGVVTIAPKCQEFAATADFDCGAAITDLESLPVSIVAYYNPPTDTIVRTAIAGTSHTTPATKPESRAFYATDAAIQAALPAHVPDDMWTMIGTVVFDRSGATVNQYNDHTTRSFELDPATKFTSADW